MDIITKQEAKLQGLNYYYTGKPCNHGHIDLRTVARSACRECVRLRHYPYYENNKQQSLDSICKWQKNNKDKVNKNSKNYRKSNPENTKASSDKYYINNKEKKLAANKLWRQNNKATNQQYNANRRALQMKAMPWWVDKKEIVKVYEECTKITKETGIKHNVDHIIPLNNKLVSGLHVPWNLQILTSTQNQNKNNKFKIE